MDDHRFDLLTKSLSAGGSRRAVLKGLLGLGGAAAAAGIPANTQAARRPAKPDPKPVGCPGIQIPVDGTCLCPEGLADCGPDCCNPGGRGADYSECCDGACCHGACTGEEVCCPYPREWCESTQECCPQGNYCCGESGCMGDGRCCDDDQCRDWPNSYCDLETQFCACAPGTCAAAQCGAIPDGCGGLLDCGPCTEWPNSYCDSARSECDCAPGACLDGQCGDVPDGCGITLYCGECTAFENSSCDAETHQCTCTPWTCEADFPGYCANNVPDGCGGLMHCSCPEGFNCRNSRCEDDLDSCHAGENWCDTKRMGCSGGNCACLPGMDGNTYCTWFMGGWNACEHCTTNDDCKQLLNNEHAVCLAVARTVDGGSCLPCTTHGACAVSCVF